MAKDNIYDLTISELILRSDGGTNNGVPTAALNITSSLNTTSVTFNFNGTAVFTSDVTNMPSGYTVVANSHVITYPTAVVPTVGSSDPMSGASIAVILGAIGSTFIVTSTVEIEHLVDPATYPNIILTGSITITATSPMYYGIKVNEVIPTTLLLDQTSENSIMFRMTASIVGRLYIVRPDAATALVSITDENGLLTTVANDFTVSSFSGLTYYILNYDTQITGTNVKTFTLNFS